MSTSATITQYFEHILLRSPTNDELNSYTSRVDSGESLSDIRDELISSHESQTYTQQVIRLYQAAFGRIPDATGLDGWVDAIRDGSKTTTDLANGFIFSQEWSNTYGTSAVTDAVLTAIYENILDRTPSADEISAWQATALSLDQVLLSIANSAEAQAKMNDEAAALQRHAAEADDMGTVYTGTGSLKDVDTSDPLDPTGPDTGNPGGGTPANAAPDAVDDAYDTLGNGNLVEAAATGLLANDTDPGDTFSVTSVEDLTGLEVAAGTLATLDNGSVTVATDGSFTFTPTADFQGDQSFVYKITDSAGQTDTATATISVNQNPDAADDGYTSVGNTVLDVAVAEGLLDNDTDGTDTLTVTGVNGGGVGVPVATTNGSVTVAADGSFEFTPDLGFTGTETFTYDVSDGKGGTDTATATITINEAVWFIDNSVAGGPGTGTQTDPFRSIDEFNTANAAGGANDPEAGDTIFLREGTGTYAEADGLNLLDGQTVIGQGQDLIVDGITLETATNAPVIRVTGANEGIELASDNTIRGLDIEGTQTNGIGIDGFNVGTATISDVAFSGKGIAVGINGGTLDATFDSIQADGCDFGIVLQDTDGSFEVTGATTISDTATAGIGLNDNDGLDVTFNTIDIDDGGLSGLEVLNGINSFTATSIAIDGANDDALFVLNSAGDTFDFGTVTIGQNNTTGLEDGVDLDSGNTGATFTFDSLNVTTLNGEGLEAADATLNIGGTANIIATTGDAAINISGVNLGTGATFASVTSTNSANEGIDLNDVDGSLTINGGSVSGAAEGIDITGGTGAFSFAGTVINTGREAVDIQDRGAGAGDITLSGQITHTNGDDPGIQILNNASGTITFSGANSKIDTSAGGSYAIDLQNNTGTTINFTGGGLDIDAATGSGFSASGGGTVTVTGTGNTIQTTTGTGLSITDTTIGAAGVTFDSISSNGALNGIVLDSTGTGAFTVTGTSTPTARGGDGSGGTIQNSTGDAISLTNTANVSLANLNIINGALHGIDANGVNGLTLNGLNLDDVGDAANEYGVFITNGTGTYSLSKLLMDNGASSHINVSQNNSGTTLTAFTLDDSTIRGANGNGVLYVGTVGTTTENFSVTNNTFDESTNDHVSITLYGNADLTSTISGNTMLATTPVGNGIDVNIGATFTGTHTLSIIDNNIQGTSSAAIDLDATAGGTGSVGATITGNIIGTTGVAGSAGTVALNIDWNGGGLTTLVKDNLINEFLSSGISIEADGANTPVNATIVGNTIQETSGDPNLDGLRVEARSGALINSSIGGTDPGEANTISMPSGFEIELIANDGTIALADYAGPNNDIVLIDAYLQALNGTLVNNVGIIGGGLVTTTGPVLLPLLAEGGQGPITETTLAADALVPVALEAVDRWAEAGLSAEELAILEGTTIQIADLRDGMVGATVGDQVLIDVNAAGWGWFTDTTPEDDLEFSAGANGGLIATEGDAALGIDLLTVIMHELGHVLGFDHTEDGLMADTLGLGERRLPEEDPFNVLPLIGEGAAPELHWVA